jgi:hypothetical protein
MPLNNKFVEFCEDHEPVYTIHDQYVCYPILRDIETKEVVCYMNQYGYKVSINGIPSHPIEDYLSIANICRRKPVYIEMKEMSKSD